MDRELSPRSRGDASVSRTDGHDDAAAGRGVAAIQADCFFVLVDGWSLATCKVALR
jgi:hypothetical protein